MGKKKELQKLFHLDNMINRKKPFDIGRVRAERATLLHLINRYCTATALDQFGISKLVMKKIYRIPVDKIVDVEADRMVDYIGQVGLEQAASDYSVTSEFLLNVYDLCTEEENVSPDNGVPKNGEHLKEIDMDLLNLNPTIDYNKGTADIA